LPLFCNGNQPDPGNATQQPEPGGVSGGDPVMQMLCCAPSLAKVSGGWSERVESKFVS
jgi:hypothetical protein